jgi:ABC-type bacteriocin/lantibiotic exporter with double-glycine peptidase domain
MIWVLLMALGGAALWRWREAATEQPPARAGDAVELGQVPPLQQQTSYTCGPVALRAVCAHYGLTVSEMTAAALVGCRTHGGVQMPGVVVGARRLGLWAQGCHMQDLACLGAFLKHGIPVMVIVRSWHHPGAGHWVVVTGITGDEVILMDPNTPGNVRHVGVLEFEARWWHLERDRAGAEHLLRRPAVIVAPATEGDSCQT